ncbi:peptidoglycan editing factor PgeF [Cohnella faecalis]|uniref:Purine nucleoside phosphorylase n=1 Tax=Cohnella faecalis TaxID=2315694 RepID=A0A398CNU5_9BACL|nr:peptidoglycan editing factor PgeF [Cohnella faecalis]RIE04273.1 peptidoglycan editing factor PgeF [Cohnella faecalis]
MEPFQPADGSDLSPLLVLESWSGPDFEGVTAGFTTRHAANTALHVGDNPLDVVRSRLDVADSLGWDFSSWTCAEQVHGVRVHHVQSGDVGRGRESRESAIPEADALITNESNVLLAMYFADCVPLYFYDPTTGALGLAHAGWKGTVADIAAHTVRRLQETFGVEPAQLYAAIGPSIGECCYEVDEAVLSHIRPLAAEAGANDVLYGESGGRARIDLKQMNRHLMIKAGILPSRIEISKWCTGCRTDLFFSHRAEKGHTGRMMSWLGRK